MKRVLTLMLSMLEIGSMGCTPSTEEEVPMPMYAAPYAEYHPSQRADIESDDITANNEEEL